MQFAIFIENNLLCWQQAAAGTWSSLAATNGDGMQVAEVCEQLPKDF